MLSFFSFILNRHQYKVYPPRCEYTKYYYIMLYIELQLTVIFIVD